jgi:hypothetical protein
MGSNETAFFGANGRLADELEKHFELVLKGWQSGLLLLLAFPVSGLLRTTRWCTANYPALVGQNMRYRIFLR